MLLPERYLAKKKTVSLETAWTSHQIFWSGLSVSNPIPTNRDGSFSSNFRKITKLHRTFKSSIEKRGKTKSLGSDAYQKPAVPWPGGCKSS